MDFFPSWTRSSFFAQIRLIGSLQPLRSETPESVRVTVYVKLDGGSRAAGRITQRIEGGGAGGEVLPIESEEKILIFFDFFPKADKLGI